MQILFRVDAGPDVGLGHLQRCLSLATAFRSRGGGCVFLAPWSEAAQARVAASGFAFEALRVPGAWDCGDLEETLASAGRHGCGVIVADSYAADDACLGELRSSGFCVVAIDDLGLHPFPCQWVVNGGAHAHRLSLRSSSGDTAFLLGPRYALLRPEFWNIPPRAAPGPVKTILVTLGGSDFHGLMPALLHGLDGLPGDFTVTAIVGPFFANADAIERARKECRREVRLVRSPESVRDLMLEADLAVSAGGQTLYELAATGTPAVAVEIADNQRPQLEVLAEDGVVCSAGNAVEGNVAGRAMDIVSFLAERADKRAGMSLAGRSLVDGRGALRVAEEICRGEGAHA